MIDFELIGKRIQEERKYLHKISQEKMAADLGMYQADISNLEKAKNGSGITDLTKLDMIADYFDMPLETLLFGRRQNQMEKYYGTKMQLKECARKLSKKHETLLRNLLRIPDPEMEKAALESISSYECGPYMIYVAHELQMLYTGGKQEDQSLPDSIPKEHFYVVYQDEVIGCMTVAITTVMQHVYFPALQRLKKFILPDVFELDDTMSTLDPYWLLSQYAVSDEEENEFRQEMLKRMDQLREAGENRIIFYAESVYVREDCRRNGIFRMLIDLLRKLDANAMIWLSLEPTAGMELSSEYDYHPAYQASELGQISMNASIAERLGFTIDSKTEDRQAERVNGEKTVIETIPVRRTAYYLPEAIKEILKEDGNMLEYARAREKTLDIGDIEGIGAKKPQIFDIYQSAWKKYGYIIAIKLVYSDETVYAFARGMDWNSRWLGVSRKNPSKTGEFVETMEKYQTIQEAEKSKYFVGLKVAEQLLGAIYFGTVEPEDVDLDELTM